MKGYRNSLIFMATLAGVPALAAELVRPFGKEEPVTMQDLRPHLTDEEGYKEEWSHNVYLPDGGFIAADFIVTNLAITSDHDGLFKAEYRQPNGKKTKCKLEFDDDEWSYAKSGFSLHFGKNHVRGDLKGLDITVRCGALSMDLRFTNEVPPFKPGRGELRFGEDDGMYGVIFHSPRAKVSGTLTHRGKSVPVQGVGHAMRTLYNMRPDKQVHRWFYFKRIDQGISLVLAEMESTAEYGLARNGWVLAFGPDKRILATARARFVYDGFIEDKRFKEAYRIPRRVRVVAVDGDNQLTGVLLMKGIQKVADFTEQMSAVRRMIVRRYAKPKDYHISCAYEFKIKTREGERLIQGEDNKYRFNYVNP